MLCVGLLSESSTTRRRDNQSLDCRSGSCTVGTIHLNLAAAGKNVAGGMSREKRIGEEREKRGARDEERERVKERKWRGRPGREKSQGEAVENKSSTHKHTHRMSGRKRGSVCELMLRGHLSYQSGGSRLLWVG